MATIARQCSPAAAIARLHRANRCVAGTIECSYNLPMFGRIREFDSTWSVSDITQYIKELFDVDLRLRDVAVEGEISNFTQARSGHLYFTLKDEQAQLRCVMWRSQAERLRFDPQNGDAVVARGRVSVYEASGAYQLYADHLEPVGRGNLALAFEQLKQRLEAEGLFDRSAQAARFRHFHADRYRHIGRCSRPARYSQRLAPSLSPRRSVDRSTLVQGTMRHPILSGL